MPDNKYTKRETDIMHDSLEEKVDSFRKYAEKQFGEIKERQDTTNGRVRWAEKMIWMAIGGVGVVGLATTILTIVTFFI